MTVTALDPGTALIVIDLQAGTAGSGMDDVVAHASELLAAFRMRGLPVALVRVAATPPGRTAHLAGSREFPAAFTEPLPGFAPELGDIPISRRAWSAFGDSDLHAALRTRGVTQIVLAGVATSFGIESTARQGYDLGYAVVIATDAVGDGNPEAHRQSIERVFPALGQTGTTAEIVALLTGV